MILKFFKQRPSWVLDGACTSSNFSTLFMETFQEIYVPGKPASASNEDRLTPIAQKCISICNTCPVQQECLDYAIEMHEDWGIWGGKTPEERHRIELKVVT